MTIASELTKLNTNLTNSYTAVSDKGGTLPSAQNFDNLATAISSIPSSGSGGKYQLLQRISDDSNNEIGTVSGFFTDANDVEYAIVCLDAQYRLDNSQYLSSTGSVSNLPMYRNWITSNWKTAKETATFNCDKILDYASSNGYTSSSVTHCRSKSFTINGTTYYGQLPNAIELEDIVLHGVEINSVDTSASSYSSLNFSTGRTCWTSTQYNASNGWFLYYGGYLGTTNKTTNNYFACPVLEIPNAL